MNTNVIYPQEQKQYGISHKLFGIFLEDIGFSVDGGLNANMVNNYSFDGVYMDKHTYGAVSDPLRYWKASAAAFASGNAPESAISSNSRYAAVTVEGSATLQNLGYNGGRKNKNKPAMYIAEGHSYLISFLFRADSYEGSVQAEVVNAEEEPLTNMSVLLNARGNWSRANSNLPNGWMRATALLQGYHSGYGKLILNFNGHGTILLDCVDLHDADCWHADDPKWKYSHMRRDLVEALAELHPRFMRFPGGCIVEGMKRGNEYNWKDTVGPLWDRKSNYSLWSEKIEDGGYNQSCQIGFYEYFCLCEDLDMEPLPTLSAGLNCQIRVMQYHFKDGIDVPVNSPEFSSYIVSNYLDLIDFATGDPSDNKWAKLRAEMGHPEPFELHMIGVGNENYGRDYLKRYDIITAAIHRDHPEIRCIQCGGFLPGHLALAPLWAHARLHHPEELLDEHSYSSPAWFEKNAHRYDLYPRHTTKVYVGEYSANGLMAGKKLAYETSNTWDSALGEAAFMTGMERNGDVVEMASYAPLLNLIGSDQWFANLIDFNPKNLCRTANYYVQQLFSKYYGFTAVPYKGVLPPRVYLSITETESNIYLKVVNAGIADTGLVIANIGHEGKTGEGERMQCDLLSQKNRLNFEGDAAENIVPEAFTLTMHDADLHLKLKSHSVTCIRLPR